MKKILVTGGSGLLGQYLNIEANSFFELLTLFKSNVGNCNRFNNVHADINNLGLTKEIFTSFKPDIVIHSAAITNPVPQLGQSSKEIYATNVNATKNIAKLCRLFNAKLIYTSTDLVYAGYRGSMLSEDAKLIPASLYAETKLMAEMKIKETLENYLILRTALLFGFGLTHSRSHFHKMNDELKNNRPVKLFTDQYRTPIELSEAAKIIVQLAQMDLVNETINLGGTERVSRFELGEILCSVASYDKSILQKITLDDVPNLPKVEDVSLNTDKLQSFGIKTKTIKENILKLI
ncbi:MAG: NAD(P)-dependent oxidoreductase [Ignavibacteriae bacterium]|nr:MAG: NAD(P)-dependent oxidoreductase [Ignavibacteriota bacterium]